MGFRFFTLLFMMALTLACNSQNNNSNSSGQVFEITKSDQEWRNVLSESAYYVLRQKGTERAFTGSLLNIKKKGVYSCAGCDNPLFHSKSKFDSGTGWPSFFEPINSRSVLEEKDYAYGMVRIEIMCKMCGGHLGHVFEDGPKPTGLRYCMNSAALKFIEDVSKN
jgi:peptide-methionine (R)-S-oxide reductase